MAAHADQIRVEQINTLYRNSTQGVLGAYVAAVILISALTYGGDLPWPEAAFWLAAMHLIVLHHIAWSYFFRRAPDDELIRPLWANGFVAAAALDGVWWGCATMWLAPAYRFDEQMLTTGLALIVVASAVPAFGVYFPAFFAIYLPTTVISLAWHAYQRETLHTAVAMLIGVYIVTVYGLGRSANASFTQMLRLRFEKDALAEDLMLQKEAADQANLSKSRFLAAASHDLRQPIHALSMFVGVLSQHALNDDMRRLIVNIEGSIQAMDGLFSSLLDISRLDAGVVQPQLQSFPIGPLLERICRDYTEDATQKGLLITCCRSSAIVRSDPILLERILRNFVSNAVRHTDQGGIVVGCRRGSRLSVQVWDSGRGIATGDRDRVFDEFYQVANPERDRSKGLGLGLAIVKRLASLLDHPIELSSAVAKGSVFKLTVPIADETIVSEPHPAEPPSLALPGRLIFVIDDEPLVLEAIGGLLRSWGADVVVAGSGAEMRAQITTCTRRPDLILCDYRLRGEENGIDVIRQLQAEYNDEIPAVLITGDTAPGRLQQANDSGFLVLYKPVANSRLRATIGNLLNRPPGAM